MFTTQEFSIPVEQLTLSELSASCDLPGGKVGVGEPFDVVVDVEGQSPRTTTYYVDVELYIGEELVGTGSAQINSNQAFGSVFEGVTIKEDGEYQVAYNLTNLRRV